MDAALAQFRAVLERAPEDATALIALGACLLAHDDAAGQSMVEQAMARNERNQVRGCGVLREYHSRIGNLAEAQVWQRRLLEGLQNQDGADKERSRITLNDKFEPHGLDDVTLDALRRELLAVPGLCRAWLVKKQVRHLMHRPLYVLGFKVTSWYQLHRKHRTQEVLRKIQAMVQFPGEMLILNVDADNVRFGRKFARKRGARVV
jgi:hypothetical protein